MFDTIVLRSGDSNRNPNLDVGTLCEALLFYQNVHLVLNQGSLNDLLSNIGIDNLRMLVEEGYCKITFFNDAVGVHTHQNHMGHSVHSFISFQMLLERQNQSRGNKRDLVVHSILSGKEKIAKGKAERLAERITVRTVKDLTKSEETVLQNATRSLLDEKYCSAIFKTIIGGLVPRATFEHQPRVRTHEVEGGIIVESNLNFAKLDELYRESVPKEHSSLTPAYLLSWYLTSQLDVAIACRYGTDISVPSLSSSVMRLSLQRVWETSDLHRENIVNFDDVVFTNVPNIKEAINSRGMTFGDFLPILKQSEKFKSWLKSFPSDADIATEYAKAATKQHWSEKLPSKGLRFAIVTGMGLGADLLSPSVGTIIGLGVGSFDSFVLDRLLKGWKPNHFVDDTLLPAIKSSIRD